ncbi:MAG TPA: fasciclin domain-containing protein [Caldilineaceae bacterium]|nr:fasciclin domain-containing protein [Caldilineaceae bacterium]
MNRRPVISLLCGLVLLLSSAPVVLAQGEPTSGGTAILENGDALVMASARVQAAAPRQQEGQANLFDIAAATDDFSTLAAALQAAGLAETLREAGPYTLFAPTNQAFEALPEGMLEGLLADPAGELAQILLYHVVPGRYSAADIVTGQEAGTLQGEVVTFDVAADGRPMVNGATIIVADHEAANGVLHVIDRVLLPEGALQPAPGAMALAAGVELQQATPAPQEEPAEPQATPAPAEEQPAAPQATPPPAQEEAAEPTPTAAPAEPAAQPTATPTATAAAPSTMPTTGVQTTGGGATLMVVLVVLAALAGGTVLHRRRS